MTTELAGMEQPAIVGRRRKMLYVEDNLSNLTLVQRILEPRGDIDLIPADAGQARARARAKLSVRI